MMRKSPDDRYATPIQVVQALDRYVDEPSLTTNRDLISPSDQEPNARSSPAAEQPGVDTVLTSVPQPFAVETAPELLKTVAVFDGSETPLQAVTEVGSRANIDEAAAALQSPPCDQEPEIQEFPLFLNFGSEPLLSDGKSRPKPRPVASPPETLIETKIPAGRSITFWLWASVAATTTVMVMLGSWALVKPFGFASAKTATGSRPIRVAKVRIESRDRFLETNPAGAADHRRSFQG